jgi:hypothetical protein
MAMTDYPYFPGLGYDIGSGPTESFCGCLTKRLKGSGMKWDKGNTKAVMSLASIYCSNQWYKGTSKNSFLLRTAAISVSIVIGQKSSST